MKKLFFVMLLVGGMLGSTFAQQNVVKWYPLSMGTGMMKVGYERTLAPKHSLALDVKYRFPMNLNNSYYQSFNEGDDEVLSSKTTGYTIGFEYRFYTKDIGNNEPNNGFYLAPYFKYNKYGLDFEVKTTETFDVGINLDYSSYGGGLGIGYQWLVSDNITVDWFIVGGGAAINNLDFEYTNADPDEDFEKVKNDILTEEGIPGFIQDEMEIEAGSNFTKGSSKFLFGSFRSGLAIGIAF